VVNIEFPSGIRPCSKRFEDSATGVCPWSPRRISARSQNLPDRKKPHFQMVRRHPEQKSQKSGCLRYHETREPALSGGLGESNEFEVRPSCCSCRRLRHAGGGSSGRHDRAFNARCNGAQHAWRGGSQHAQRDCFAQRRSQRCAHRGPLISLSARRTRPRPKRAGFLFGATTLVTPLWRSAHSSSEIATGERACIGNG
jgi:hypothetical protein